MARIVQVWDLPVRLFHWSLVLLVVISFTTGKIGGNWMLWHAVSGYCILALLLFRILWGLFGSQTARFANFVRGPKAVIAYLRGATGGKPAFHAGHNPAGALMILLLLALLLVQVTTGLFADDEIAYRAPLADKAKDSLVSLFTTIHRINVNLILASVVLHVAAALFYLKVKKENLIRPLVTGRREVPDDHPAPVIRSLIPAGAMAAAVAGFVWWLVSVFPAAA